jgi:SAM-dependent methyltransferase
LEGIPCLREPRESSNGAADDWSDHWSVENQAHLAQRFFSFYRKVVFARAVNYFLEGYFPDRGVFVEAGAGTGETSSRVAKHGGARFLVAVDVLMAVLRQCHPIMDVRLCADIFSLPFQNGSIDGIWNVGVMEHFTREQIDIALREFHRVPKHGGRVILLWPSTTSVPQQMLRLVEWLINHGANGKRFRFHPDEISQLSSSREGRGVLRRNGFRPLHIDTGPRSAMAFMTLVGEKL